MKQTKHTLSIPNTFEKISRQQVYKGIRYGQLHNVVRITVLI